MTDDDDLSEILRSEVPAPGPGFWDDIDARLDAIESERATAHDVGGPIAEISSRHGHTDAEVIRLKDMTRSQSPARTRRLLPAAAAVVIVAIGIGFLVTRNSPTEVDTAGPGTTEAASADSTAPVNNAATVPPTSVNTTQEPVAGDVDVEANSVWVAPGTTQAFVAPGGEAFGEEGWMLPVVATGESADVDGRSWLAARGLAGTPDVWFPIDVLERVATGLDSGEAGSVIVTGSTVNLRSVPGLGDDPVDSVTEGTILSSTGIRAEADDLVWLLIDDSVGVLWLAESFTRPATEADLADELRPINPSRNCFGDADSLLVLDFSEAADTFLGRLRTGAEVRSLAGVRIDGTGTDFRVFGEVVGSGAEGDPIVLDEQWQAFPEGMSAADIGVIPAIACADRAAEVDELTSFVVTVPEIPSQP